MRKLLLFFFLGMLSIHASATNDDFGGKVGVSFQFGNHIQRIGVMYQLYYYSDFIQISQGTSFHYNRRNLGPRSPGFEMQSLLGFQFYWGKVTKQKKYLLSEYSLMAEKKFSGGLVYKFYLDQVETTQFTGGLFFNIDRFGFVFENDLLGGPKGFQDKFRTGGVALSFAMDSLQVSIQSTHWTGIGSEGKLVKETDYPSKHGYRDLSEVKHGKISHGILALRVDYLWKYNQTIRIESGIDAEQIRHALQNKLVHDFLIPSNKNFSGNPHYPMLQADGMPYLFIEGQKIRPARLYFQSGLNPFFFY